jgi:hypothetical protein
MRFFLYMLGLCFAATNFANHIAALSEPFLGKPYLRNALGEGPQGYYDQRPLYRTDVFDCETLVDTVLALELSSPSQNTLAVMNRVRYRHGKISFLNRNHFTCKDWNPNNQAQGFITDITAKIHDTQNLPVYQHSQALINPAEWIQHFDLSHIYLTPVEKTEAQKRLRQLKQHSRPIQATLSSIDYIPLTALFNRDEQPNLYLFHQIPEGAIIEIIRPNWDLTKEIGTHLQVSHMGFALWKKDTLYFREASSIAQKVIDTPLIPYLKAALTSPTIKGINIQKINS